MVKNLIKSFSVYGLFGKDDVHIPFDENIKILIGENGIGKTQVLSIFYYTLTGDYLKLTEFPFYKIELAFDNKHISLSKDEIIEHLEKIYKTPTIKEIIDTIGISKFEAFKNEAERLPLSRIRNLMENHPVYSQIATIANEDSIFDILRRERLFSRKSKKKKEKLPHNIAEFLEKSNIFFEDYLILYFPTFRRVEEDLHNLGYDEDRFVFSREDNRLIHFGMEDVQNKFDHITKRIDLLLKEGFTKISSEILTKLVTGFGNTDKEILDKINETDINIILARVGEQIADTEKDKIREIVLNKKVSNTDNSLFYFIQALVDIYEQQREFDNSIKKFQEICNNYLIGKKVFYDESNIKIYIKSDSSSKPLSLNKLSSGEKQIISIFSKIYLSEADQKFIVLFDEPELSLSMPWQKKLLPDILASNKCDFLLAVTHSPFIFDNELDRYAVGLNEYIQPQDKVTA